MKERFDSIAVEKIVPSRTNPRNSADYKDADLRSLALSIAENGLIQPITVRPHPSTAGDYELVAGERRYRAHLMKESGKTTIDAIIREYTDEQVIVVQNIENLQRKDVHPLDEARSFRALLELKDPETKAPKFTVAAIADEVGMEKSYVYKTLVLNNLLEVFHPQFRSGKITRQIAMMLARQTPEQQEKLAGWVENELECNYAIDPESLSFEIEHEFHLELAGAPFDKADATLVEAAGPCTTCGKSTANAPDLFNDLGKKAKCTDSACFNLKKEATFERNMKALRSSGESFVIINPDRPGTKNVLGSDEYKPAKKSDKGAVQAIHRDEKKRGAIEWVKPSRIPMEEEKNGSKKPTKKKRSSDGGWEEQQRKEKARKEASIVLLKPVAEKIIAAAAQVKPTKEIEETIHQWMIKTMLAEARTHYLSTVLISDRAGDSDLLAHLRKSLTDDQILHLLFQMDRNGFDVSYDGNIDPVTYRLCKAFGFDGKKMVEDGRKALEKTKEKTKKNEATDEAKETAAAIAHSKNATTAVGVGKKPAPKKKAKSKK